CFIAISVHTQEQKNELQRGRTRHRTKLVTQGNLLQYVEKITRDGIKGKPSFWRRGRSPGRIYAARARRVPMGRKAV
ncbi:unnamed protein product, partial [Ascophyllum nodosum]